MTRAHPHHPYGFARAVKCGDFSDRDGRETAMVTHRRHRLHHLNRLRCVFLPAGSARLVHDSLHTHEPAMRSSELIPAPAHC